MVARCHHLSKYLFSLQFVAELNHETNSYGTQKEYKRKVYILAQLEKSRLLNTCLREDRKHETLTREFLILFYIISLYYIYIYIRIALNRAYIIS